MNSIEIVGLSKRYGKKLALQNVNLTIESGLYGLLGRNGAGKTTLMRILTTLLPKTDGKVSVCGVPVEKAASVRPLIGYLPQEFSFYPGMTVYKAMDYLGVLSGMDKAMRKKRIEKLLAEVNLIAVADLRMKALSGGMRRRFGVAQALLHDPKVIIVDEPTAGLDPEERVRLRELLCAIARERTVLLSTHIVEDVEKTCERIGVLRDGEFLYDGLLTDFTKGRDLETAYMQAMKTEGGEAQ